MPNLCAMVKKRSTQQPVGHLWDSCLQGWPSPGTGSLVLAAFPPFPKWEGQCAAPTPASLLAVWNSGMCSAEGGCLCDRSHTPLPPVRILGVDWDLGFVSLGRVCCVPRRGKESVSGSLHVDSSRLPVPCVTWLCILRKPLS